MAKKPALQVRAPKNPDDFVAGGAHPTPSAQTSAAERQRSTAPSELPTKVRGLVPRADGGARVRITVYLEPDVGVKLKRHCFENGLQVSDVAAEAVTKYVSKLERG